MKRPSIRTLLALSSLGIFTAGPLAAQPMLVYAENFANTQGWGRDRDLGTPDTGWFGILRGHDRNNWAAETNSTDPWAAGPGYVPGPALNNNPAVGGYTGTLVSTVQLVFAWALYTREFTDLQAQDLTSIRWHMFSDGGAGGDFNVLLKVGGEWYTPSERFSKSLSTGWDLFEADLTTTNWLHLPGMAIENVSTEAPAQIPRISDALAASLPGGQVEAFGLLFDNTLNTGFNIDNYQIYAIPEPRAAALALGLTGLLLALRRRRARR